MCVYTCATTSTPTRFKAVTTASMVIEINHRIAPTMRSAGNHER